MSVSIATLSITQLCTASLSFISSVIIVFMISCSSYRFSTPYSRIMFGLSISDILISLGFILGPFASPRGSDLDPWSIGNVYTCNFDGFLVVFGSVTVPFYLLLLCSYFYAKIVRKMTNRKFLIKIERQAHATINVIAWSLSLYLLSTKAINPIGGGSACYMARYPQSCVFGETPCTRGKHAPILSLVHPGLSLCICLIAVVVLLILICSHIINNERNMDWQDDSEPNDESNLSNQRQCSALCRWRLIEQRENETDAQFKIRLWTRETAIQAFLYILISFLSYAHIVVSLISRIFIKTRTPAILDLFLGRSIYPILGLFNLLIFIRPKAMQARLMHPGLSWPRALYLVITTAGEIPNEINDTIDVSLICFKRWCCYWGRDIDETAMRVNDIATPSNEAMFRTTTQAVSRISALESVFVVQRSFDDVSRVILEAHDSDEGERDSN